ncbi:NaeI family type II restriction endonuclease [Citromicrobium bathyomarinum]|uniref:NaeI family type II restriction endonuclease n=1 Tax=Citromicrobium bathyomarinum TaxID=72174 RepID=UPI00315B27DC
MRSDLSTVDKDHPDYALLSALRDEIAKRAGGLSTLEENFPLLVRDAVDFLLDSVRTARTRVSELDNVEKTFIGLKLEHFVRDMLDVPKGIRDLVVAGVDVDIKNTVQKNWSIPQETYRSSEPCVLMAIDDDKYCCSLGLIIAKPEYLHKGAGNRDTKKGVSIDGFKHIMWLVAEQPFPASRFAGLDMNRFRELRKVKGGKERAAQFFRENLFKVVHRDVARALLFDQYDPMKRLRKNGGAPDVLSQENIAVLIGTYLADRRVAGEFGFGSLARDEIVAVKARSEEEIEVLRRNDMRAKDLS